VSDQRLGTVVSRPRSGRLPGVDGFWVLVAGDLVLFTALFVGFVRTLASDVAAAEAARASLDPDRGGINTLLLLTSSWCVVRAIHAARSGSPAALRWITAGIAGGLGFVVVKGTEYVGSISHGHPEAQAEFFSWYYAITGLHLGHVVIGCVLLTVFAVRWRRRGPTGGEGADTVAVFWHLVDALWIVIFPLIYLVQP
jgi:nitric oxide reductase NorE protein